MPRPIAPIAGAPKGRLRKIDPGAPPEVARERAERPASPAKPAPVEARKAPPPLPPQETKKRSLPPKARSIAPKAASLPPAAIVIPKGAPAFVPDEPARSRSIIPTSTPDDAGQDAPSVLVVDDDDAARRLIVRALRTLYTVYEATDGEEAVRVLERVPPVSCVVTDIMMPRIDGVMLAKKMRADARLKGVPIIFVTGKGAAGALDSVNIGVRFYIQKPFKVKDLVEKVRTVVLTTAGSGTHR